MRSMRTTCAVITLGGQVLASALPVQAENGRNAAAIGGLAAGALLGGAIAGGPPAYGPRYRPAPVYGAPLYEEDYAPVCHIERQAIVNS